MAQKADIKQEERDREEYLLILNAFRRMVYNLENNAESWEMFDEIVSLRASFLIDRVLIGLHLDFDVALEMLQNKNLHLTAKEEIERDTLIAAIDNMIDFAAAEETAMMRKLPDELNPEDMESYEDVCRTYNEIYADTENGIVEHAALIAGWWINTSDESIITFMTQGDERVREWHLSLEGTSYLKSEFPAELIPPIEWRCRCYLVSNGYASVFGSLTKPDIKGKIDPVFTESLAKGGRIFSPAHHYFAQPLPVEVEAIKQRLKTKFGIV